VLKCLLIISQYYHSRHYFIVERFKNEAVLYYLCRRLIEEMEDHKRSDTRPYEYGDITEDHFKSLKWQRNVNDSGDIYFIPCGSIAKALYEMRYYQDCTRREAQGYKKQAVLSAISEHHDKTKIGEMVGRYFEIL